MSTTPSTDRPDRPAGPAGPAGKLRRSLGVVDRPVVLLLGFLPVLGIAGAYTRLNRSEPNCGNGYVRVGRTLGPWPGFLTGWVTTAGTVVFLAYTTAITGSVVLAFANKAGWTEFAGIALDPGSTVTTTLVGMVVLTVVTVLAVTGVRSATRLQAGLLVFEYAVLLTFCAVAVVTGDHPVSLAWFDPFRIHSGTGFAQGLVLAVFFFWGWESAFSVTEETRGPADSSRGGLIALFAMLGLFLFASIAFQREMSLTELIENGPRALPYLGAKLTDEPWAGLPLLALMFSAVASLQANVIPTARGLFAMGRDRTMGQAWTRVHPRYGTPALGTVILMSVSAAIALLAMAIPRLSDMLLAAVNSAGLLVALYYGLTALACAVRFRAELRAGVRAALLAVVVPAVSGLFLLGTGAFLGYTYLTTSDHFELSPDNGWFMFALPAVTVLSGLAMAAVAKYVRRSPYFITGRGTDADSLTLPMDRTVA